MWIEHKPRTAKVGAIFKAQKMQIFQNMLMTFFMENSQKSFTQRKLSVLGKRFRSSDIALYSEYYVQISDSIEKNIGGYVLRKPNVR